MSERFDIAGIGNAIVDVIFPASDDFLLEHGIAKSVMTLIDEFRAEQLISLAEDAKTVSGGSAANTMAGLASFGAKGKFIGKVKNDSLGQRFADDLKAAGVNFTTPMADTSLADRVLSHRRDARRPAQHEHVSRRLPRADAGRHRPSEIGGRRFPLYRRLYVGRGASQGGDPQGHRRRQGRGTQRRLHPLRSVLRRPLPRRIPASDEDGHRHPVRQ